MKLVIGFFGLVADALVIIFAEAVAIFLSENWIAAVIFLIFYFWLKWNFGKEKQ